MNKEYTYIDGKAIIRDENGNQKPIEYYDNLDKVLVQENVVETIEDRISHLEKAKQKYENCGIKKYKPFILIFFALEVLISPALAYFFLEATIKGSLIFGLICSCVMLPLGGLFEWINYNQLSEILKRKKGINSELVFLSEQLPKESEKLIELQKEKTTTKENKEFRVVEVDDKKALKELSTCSDLYFDLGYDMEKYYKYYKQGKLDKELGQYYNNIGIDIAKNYLEEKGTTLVKKRKK